jgi:hypothetical protein
VPPRALYGSPLPLRLSVSPINATDLNIVVGKLDDDLDMV